MKKSRPAKAGSVAPALFRQMAALGRGSSTSPERSKPVARKPSISELRRSDALRRATALLARKDPTLGKVIRQIGTCRLKPESAVSPFAALMEAIVYQQLNGKAASAILARVKALLPRPDFPTPGEVLKLPEERLRAAGLSRAKTAAIKDLCAKAVDGLVPDSTAIARMPDNEIIARLTEIRGVGRWTVEMLLIFKLGRPDVLPATDYGIRQGFARTYDLRELPAPGRIAAHGEIWRPYRTVASWYLWRSLELP